MCQGITVADILAIVAILVSIVTSCVTIKKERESARKDHELALFGDIYKDYLINRFPVARSKLSISEEGVLSGTDDLIDCLNSMRKDFLYFRYSDSLFYDRLKKHLQGLEDDLILSEENHFTKESATGFLHRVEQSIQQIYEDLSTHF